MKNKPFIYEGLGFPVVIKNPTFGRALGEEYLDLSPDLIMDEVFSKLPTKKGHFCGSEVKFIRNYMDLTQAKFARLLGVDQTSVTKWERKKLKKAGMENAVELLLRAHCRLHLNSKNLIGKSFILDVIGDLQKNKEVGEPLMLDF